MSTQPTLSQHALHPDARRDGCFARDCRCAFTSDLVVSLISKADMGEVN